MKAVLLIIYGAVCCAAGQSDSGTRGDDCPSQVWVQFNNNCYTFLHEALKNSLSISVARDLCKGNNAFKWYDSSELKYSNWRDEGQINEDLDTCTKMNTTTGLWDVIDCEHFREIGTLCKTRTNTKKGKSQTGQRALIITLIITIALLVGVVSSVLFIMYKRKFLTSGFRSGNLTVASQVLPYTDEDILVNTLEKEDSA
ncbi:CD302 antigen [Discoglossus pictus]